jgi:aldose 1-epimerase
VDESQPESAIEVVVAAETWRAWISPMGATLRQVSVDGVDVLDGFEPLDVPTGARGMLLAPWTNRLRDGRYEFGGRSHQLDVTDRATGTALHGLVGAVPWEVVRHDAGSATLEHRLAGARGYPWDLLLRVTYEIDATGLTVTHEARNLSSDAAPYAVGAHPYVVAGPGAGGAVDDWTVALDATEVMLVDRERMLPSGVVAAGSAGLDLRDPRRVGSTTLNHAFSGLRRGADDRAHVTVSAPGGCTIDVWAGAGCRWIQLYTGDFDPVAPRRSIAVEPMSAPADAFNSGLDLVVLAPAGEDGSTHLMQWGIGAGISA